MTLAEKLAAIKERLDGVTPGPWRVEHIMAEIDFIIADRGEELPWKDVAQVGLEPADEYGTPPEEARANAQYLATLDPQTVAAIIARYERMEKALREIAKDDVSYAFEKRDIAREALGDDNG